MTRRPLVVLLLLLVTAASCGGGGGGDQTTDATPGATAAAPATGLPSGSAEIQIVEPTEGTKVKAGDVLVRTSVKGFKLVDDIGGAPKAGEGHIVYYRGTGYEIPVAGGQVATSGGQGAFNAAPVANDSYTWVGVPAGPQTFTVQLVTSDTKPLQPPVSAQVTVTVEP
jgi:hypothetical protein